MPPLPSITGKKRKAAAADGAGGGAAKRGFNGGAASDGAAAGAYHDYGGGDAAAWSDPDAYGVADGPRPGAGAAKPSAQRKCGLCKQPGHIKTSCPMNPDRKGRK
jgi:hypothetical protein